MLSADARAYLVAQGVAGGVTGWPVYVGYMPDDQDQCVGVFDTGGGPADTMARENRQLTLQTRVRAARLDYVTCYAKWLQIFNALQDAKAGGGQLAGVIFVQAMSVGPAVFYDHNHRPNMTSNWRALVTV